MILGVFGFVEYFEGFVNFIMINGFFILFKFLEINWRLNGLFMMEDEVFELDVV